jgi:hypothetical protein
MWMDLSHNVSRRHNWQLDGATCWTENRTCFACSESSTYPYIYCNAAPNSKPTAWSLSINLETNQPANRKHFAASLASGLSLLPSTGEFACLLLTSLTAQLIAKAYNLKNLFIRPLYECEHWQNRLHTLFDLYARLCDTLIITLTDKLFCDLPPVRKQEKITVDGKSCSCKNHCHQTLCRNAYRSNLLTVLQLCHVHRQPRRSQPNS